MLTSTNKSLAFDPPKQIAAMLAVRWMKESSAPKIMSHASLNLAPNWLHCHTVNNTDDRASAPLYINMEIKLIFKPLFVMSRE